MTDLEKMTSLFTELGVDFKVKTEDVERGELETDTHIKVYEGVGYPGFFCRFYFLNGKFVGQGVFE